MIDQANRIVTNIETEEPATVKTLAKIIAKEMQELKNIQIPVEESLESQPPGVHGAPGSYFSGRWTRNKA